jgi:hypothetical protein
VDELNNKKRIGILSFPTACNHGAYLQVYALQKYLISEGYHVDIINYRNRRHFLNEMRSMFLKKNIITIFSNIVRYLGFRKAQKRFNMRSMVFDVNKIKSEQYDVVIIGGDIVWDYESVFIGHDPIYYGHGLSSKKIISYAASAGKASAHLAPHYVKAGVELFSAIGVRDSESLKISNIGHETIEKKIVLDTTLIYDFDKTEFKNKKKGYILVYAFTVTEEDRAELEDFADANNLDIFSVTFNKGYSWANKNFFNIDPLHFVYLVEHANYIYTSTFHGLLFSIKYKKQVALRNNSTINTKCSWLIENLSLKNVVISSDRNISKIFSDKNLFDDSFDNSLTLLREQSRSFLHRSIEGLH